MSKRPTSKVVMLPKWALPSTWARMYIPWRRIAGQGHRRWGEPSWFALQKGDFGWSDWWDPCGSFFHFPGKCLFFSFLISFRIWIFIVVLVADESAASATESFAQVGWQPGYIIDVRVEYVSENEIPSVVFGTWRWGGGWFWKNITPWKRNISVEDWSW